MLIGIVFFFHSAPCLKDTQCACITWKTFVRHLTGLLHTGNGLTITGRCTKAGSPTRDLDRWVIFPCIPAPSVTLCHHIRKSHCRKCHSMLHLHLWHTVSFRGPLEWMLNFGSYFLRHTESLMAEESIFSMTVHITILLERIMPIL